MSTNELIHLDRERMERRGDTPMTSAEVIDELVWLLDGGTHPLVAAEILGKSWPTLTKAAERLGRGDEINRIDAEEWRRYSARPSGGRRRAA